MNIVLVYLIRYFINFVCATGRIARRPIDEKVRGKNDFVVENK